MCFVAMVESLNNRLQEAADGGHPEAGPFHLIAHLIYFGVPIALAVFGFALLWVKNHRQ